jgi:hypothetical protein
MRPRERASLIARALLPILAACSRSTLDVGTYAGDGAAGEDSPASGGDVGPPNGGCVAPSAGAVRTVTTVGSSRGEPSGLAIWGSDLYWASDPPSGTGWLQTVSTAGGPVTILGTAQVPFGVAVDATDVYWTSAPDPGDSNSTWLLRMTPRGGGATKVVATSMQGIGNLALGPTGVYWVPPYGSLMRTPLGGGTASTVVSAPPGVVITCVALDESNLYWATVTAGTDRATILKMPLAGGAPVALGSGVGCNGLATGASFVVWDDNYGIESVPINDAGATTTVVPDPYGLNPTLVAVDCGFVYWATATEVMKAPITGGSPTTLAPRVAGWGTATGFAFDATSLYFATQTPCSANPQLGCAVVERITPK